jgi:beta-galactosidase
LPGIGRISCLPCPKVGQSASRPIPWDRIGAIFFLRSEIPNLYTVLVSLRDSEGRIPEAVNPRFRFRKVKIKESRLFINGKSVLLKGANRHEIDPFDGRAVSLGRMIRDITLLKGNVRIKNKYQFLNLSEFQTAWAVSEDGAVMESGFLPLLDIAPGETATVAVPFTEPAAKPGAEYWLKIEFALLKDAIWAKKGHIVAWQQMALPFAEKVKPEILQEEILPLILSETEKYATITGKDFSLIFSKKSGAIETLMYGDRKIIGSEKVLKEKSASAPGASDELPGMNGPLPNFFRAPVDNDHQFGKGVGPKWRSMQLWDVMHQAENVKVAKTSEKSVEIAVSMKSTAKKGYGVKTEFIYTVWGNGFIHVTAHFAPDAPDIPIPKLGLMFQLAGDLEYVEWYGRGPQENYRDRKRSADIGRYESTATGMFEPYVKPQDMGNRDDARWVCLADRRGSGAMMVADETFDFSALHYKAEDLDREWHPFELARREETILCIDAGHHGLGGASCGPPPMKKYTLNAEPKTLSFSIRPYRPSFGDRISYARKIIRE